MADTDTEPVANGTGGFSAEEEDERMKQRPADIDADVREMERRKRVEAIMASKLFREELERVLDQQLHEGGGAAPLLQQIQEMVGAPAAARLHQGAFKAGNCVLPINDIRGMEGMGYEKGEKILRCKLAAVYRLVDLFGWSQGGMSGQISARLNTPMEHFLTAARGLLPHEVTASSLIKVDMQGVVQDQGTTNFSIDLNGFTLNSWVHAARPDVRCILHVRSAAALAVSSTRSGLLPLCPEAAMLGDVAYHTLTGGELDEEERDALVRALGPSRSILVLSNVGALCCGATLEEAFHAARCLTVAADVQLRLASVPLDNLNLLSEEARKQIYEKSRRAPADGVKWRVGGEEFEGLMRMLDNAGFRTGYIYRHPLVKGDVPKPKNDVEVPPAVSSLGYLFEEEELYKQGLWKKIDGRKVGDRNRWLNSPNAYQKVEVLETGTTDPKKITKWVSDGSPSHSSTPVKIDGALMFVPKNTNPKEFKKLQQQIKDNRRADIISAGPQSHILEGVTWDEANKMATAEDAGSAHVGDHVVLMGAASKGIIQRGHQHNAAVYKAPYARNPFDAVTDDEINEYRRTVERKARGEYDTDLSESEAQSAAQVTSPASAPSETEEESRDDHHRVLRIETKQAPRPSQPEVVLSDDNTDFMNAERSAFERTPTKVVAAFAKKSSDLFTDDEVFYKNLSSVNNSMGAGVYADEAVIVRSYQVPVEQRVLRDKLSMISPVKNAPAFNNLEAKPEVTPTLKTSSNQHIAKSLTTNRRTLYNYPRSPQFQNILHTYEGKNIDNATWPRQNAKRSMNSPRCRVSLKYRDSANLSTLSSLSSLEESGFASVNVYSVPGVLKLYDPRVTVSLDDLSIDCYGDRLYRTHSHAGLLSSYVSYAEPYHFHLPRCALCGVYMGYCSWEHRTKGPTYHKHCVCKSMSSSGDYANESITNSSEKSSPHHDKTITEALLPEKVIVKETKVPTYNVKRVELSTEFVECQEFHEDWELNQSFSSQSENQTVIERLVIENHSSSSDESERKVVQDVDTKENKFTNIPKDMSFNIADNILILYGEVLVELKEHFQNKTDEELDCSQNNCEMSTVNDEINCDKELDKYDIQSNVSEDDMHDGIYVNYGEELSLDDAVTMEYASPIQDLFNKDIRNYTVPISLYYDDFTSPRPLKYAKLTTVGFSDNVVRSPRKVKDIYKVEPMEPILEESKSSNEDETSNISIASCSVTKDCKLRKSEPLAPILEVLDSDEDCELQLYKRKVDFVDTVTLIISIVDEIVINAFADVQSNIDILATNFKTKLFDSFDYNDVDLAEVMMTSECTSHFDETGSVPICDFEKSFMEKCTSLDCEDVFEDDFEVSSEDTEITKWIYNSGNDTSKVYDVDDIDICESVNERIDIKMQTQFDRETKKLSVIVEETSEITSELSDIVSFARETSYDSTIEFEHLEIVSDILSMIMEQVFVVTVNDEIVDNVDCMKLEQSKLVELNEKTEKNVNNNKDVNRKEVIVELNDDTTLLTDKKTSINDYMVIRNDRKKSRKNKSKTATILDVQYFDEQTNKGMCLSDLKKNTKDVDQIVTEDFVVVEEEVKNHSDNVLDVKMGEQNNKNHRKEKKSKKNGKNKYVKVDTDLFTPEVRQNLYNDVEEVDEVIACKNTDIIEPKNNNKNRKNKKSRKSTNAKVTILEKSNNKSVIKENSLIDVGTSSNLDDGPVAINQNTLDFGQTNPNVETKTENKMNKKNKGTGLHSFTDRSRLERSVLSRMNPEMTNTDPVKTDLDVNAEDNASNKSALFSYSSDDDIEIIPFEANLETINHCSCDVAKNLIDTYDFNENVININDDGENNSLSSEKEISKNDLNSTYEIINLTGSSDEISLREEVGFLKDSPNKKIETFDNNDVINVYTEYSSSGDITNAVAEMEYNSSDMETEIRGTVKQRMSDDTVENKIKDQAFLLDGQTIGGSASSTPKLPKHDIIKSLNSLNKKNINVDTDKIETTLSTLYERDDMIMGSPFLKKAAAITMSHKAKKHGIKFWVSFDEGASDFIDELPSPVKKCVNVDEKVPTFFSTSFKQKSNIDQLFNDSFDLAIDLSGYSDEFLPISTAKSSFETINNDKSKRINTSVESVDKFSLPSNYYKRHSALCRSLVGLPENMPKKPFQNTNFVNLLKREQRKYDSDSFVPSFETDSKNDSFETASSSCNEEFVPSNTKLDQPTELLTIEESTVEIYDSCRNANHVSDEELLSRINDSLPRRRRLGFSWPPFEDTLFYKILSQFRMSESFDPNDFRNLDT